MISTVIFDLDGTLTTTPSPWQHIHERFGLWRDTACVYMDEWRSGSISYEEFCRRDAGLWAGRSLKEIEGLLDEIDLNRHVPLVVQNLVDRRIPSIIISSGFRYVARRIQKKCGWQPLIIHANELVEGPDVRIHVSGDFSSPLSKKALAEQTLRSVGGAWSATLVVSDSMRDLEQLADCRFQLLVQEEDDLLQVNDLLARYHER
jgi:phosphoserine phosphatase